MQAHFCATYFVGHVEQSEGKTEQGGPWTGMIVTS